MFKDFGLSIIYAICLIVYVAYVLAKTKKDMQIKNEN